MLFHNTVGSYKNLLRTAFQRHEPDNKTAIAMAIVEEGGDKVYKKANTRAT
jgi:hypothetical protein